MQRFPGCVDIWDIKVLRSAAGAHFKLPIQTSLDWEQIIEQIDPDSEVFAADNSSAFAEELDTQVAEEENSEVDEESSEEKEMEEKAEIEEEKVEKRAESTFERKKRAQAEKLEMKRRKRKEHMEMRQTIATVPYYFVDYTLADAVLIVGGETAGLSEGSVEFMKDRSGVRVHVPLYNNMESLNTSMAMGIVSYEICRQHSLKFEKKEDEKKQECENVAS